MPTLRDSLVSVLTNDATLTGILTGGLHVDTEISRQLTPTAFDGNKEILPCAALRMTTSTPSGVYPRGALEFFTLYFYQFRGYSSIQSAMARVYELLHDQKVGSGVWLIKWAEDLPEVQDAVLQCSLGSSRYQVWRHR